MADASYGIVYDYLDDKKLVYSIPEYVITYLKRFNIIDLDDIVYINCGSLDGSIDYYKPRYVFEGKELGIDSDKLDYYNRTWYLRHRKYQIASIGPEIIRIKRRNPEIDIPQEWKIVTTKDEHYLSVRCIVFGGISFQISIDLSSVEGEDAEIITIKACYIGRLGTYTITFHQTRDEQFYNPCEYLDYIATTINSSMYDKDNSDYAFESGLIYDIAHDSRIKKVLKAWMPGELINCDDIENEGHVYIKKEFIRKRKE